MVSDSLLKKSAKTTTGSSVQHKVTTLGPKIEVRGVLSIRQAVANYQSS